jgi:hypothetical protein
MDLWFIFSLQPRLSDSKIQIVMVAIEFVTNGTMLATAGNYR